MSNKELFLNSLLSVKNIDYPKKVELEMQEIKLKDFIEQNDIEIPLEVKIAKKILMDIMVNEDTFGISYVNSIGIEKCEKIVNEFNEKRKKHLFKKMKESKLKFNKKLLKKYL